MTSIQPAATLFTGPFTGVGVGLRNRPFAEVAQGNPGVPFWEIAPENVLENGGAEHETVCRILERDPVLTHGLGLSVGGFDPFDDDDLEQLAGFLDYAGSPCLEELLRERAVIQEAYDAVLASPVRRSPHA